MSKTIKPCPTCDGSGTVLDSVAEGALRKTQREDARLTLEDVSKRTGYSPQYLSDLEHGRRGWHEAVRAKYLKAVNK